MSTTAKQTGIKKVAAKGDELQETLKIEESVKKSKIVLTDEMKKELEKIDTKAELKKTVSNHSANVYNFDNVRKAKEFENYAYSSETTLRKKLRSKQDSICAKIQDSAKDDNESTFIASLKDLKEFNKYLHNEAIFCNNKRENISFLKRNYDLYFSNKHLIS